MASWLRELGFLKDVVPSRSSKLQWMDLYTYEYMENKNWIWWVV